MDTNHFRMHIHTILGPNYSEKVYSQDPHFVRFERSHDWQTDAQEIDVFGNCWTLAWTDFTNNQVSIHTRGQRIFLNGSYALFIPPFSIIDWRFKGGIIYWQGLISNIKLPSEFPHMACMIKRNMNEIIPYNISELEKFITNHSIDDLIYKEEIHSSVASKTKKYIDSHWSTEFAISEMSQCLGYSHAVMDRAFKQCYGLSPIMYRNKMRIMEAAHKLLLGQDKIADVAFDVGFSEVDNFNRQFKKILKVTPSHYLRGENDFKK